MSLNRLSISLLILTLLSPFYTSANILRVPDEYSSIQVALNELSNNDTVLVSNGTYAEDLIAPARIFWLIGEVPVDSGDFSRPIIDPSLLPDDSIQNGCLVLPQNSNPTIEKIRFRNRRDISQLTNASGGIYCRSNSAVFRYCSFDSTRGAIKQEQSDIALITIDHCVFRWNVPVVFLPGSEVHAENCSFSNNNDFGFWLVVCGRHSVINNCRFVNGTRTYLTNWGDDVRFSNCIFGPGGIHAFAEVDLTHFDGVIENNLFIDSRLQDAGLKIETNCNRRSQVIQGNVFAGCTSHSNDFNAVPIKVFCDSDWVYPYILENNVITACSLAGPSKGIWALHHGEFSRNRLYNLRNPLGQTGTAVYCDYSDSMVFRENLIYNNGTGILATHEDQIDARFNWWGDSTGPYEPNLNPDGQGDRVNGDILFEPWLTDTLFMEVEDRHTLIPKEFKLEVFPNPFNSQTKIRFVAPEAGIYQLELFDLIGRRVKEIFHGPAVYVKEISFDAGTLASGIYFVRAKESIYNRPLATQKLVLLK